MCLVAIVWAVSGSGCSMVSAPYGAVTGPVGFFRDHAAYNDASESLVLGWRNHVWSKRAWYQQRHLFVSHAHVKDFGKGFQAGYNEVANGGDGCVPVLPPREYWSWRYQSPEGQGKTAAWFEGYPLGAAAADKDGIANWGHIQTGYTADSKSIRGRANYVRIREELLKKEMRGEAEEVNPPGPSATVPGVLPPSVPDDLPPPKRTTPPGTEGAKTPDAKPNDGPQINPLPPVLPNPAGQSGTDDSAQRRPAAPLEQPAPTLVRLPAVEPEPSPIQHAHVEVAAPAASSEANPFETQRIAPFAQQAISQSSLSEKPAAEHAVPAVTLIDSAPVVHAAPVEARKSRIGTVSHSTPATQVRERMALDDAPQQPTSYKRSVALYSAGEKDAPPAMKSEGEPVAPAAPTSTATAGPSVPLPPMRQLRRNAELPEAPAPSPIRSGTQIAREVLRDDRVLRSELGGPILERRATPPAGETRLSDGP